ncbi:Hypothetical protein NTJ_04715 [Nesidiocoris tenuis]|uniref:Uncharacterized protein n=1 Tax=Nesidiocoris tenuis TaxID=355587 RepID=A0ABN7AKS5_9HEMI|nr:Hypothetical protein NTJ_04715 [Nesidiocoris tenuis]
MRSRRPKRRTEEPPIGTCSPQMPASRRIKSVNLTAATAGPLAAATSRNNPRFNVKNKRKQRDRSREVYPSLTTAVRLLTEISGSSDREGGSLVLRSRRCWGARRPATPSVDPNKAAEPGRTRPKLLRLSMQPPLVTLVSNEASPSDFSFFPLSPSSRDCFYLFKFSLLR